MCSSRRRLTHDACRALAFVFRDSPLVAIRKAGAGRRWHTRCVAHSQFGAARAVALRAGYIHTNSRHRLSCSIQFQETIMLSKIKLKYPLAALACAAGLRSEEHTSELQSLMRISYAVFCLKKKNTKRK